MSTKKGDAGGKSISCQQKKLMLEEKVFHVNKKSRCWTKKVFHFDKKKVDVGGKSISCQQKKLMLDKKGISFRQKQDEVDNWFHNKNTASKRFITVL